MASHNSGQRDSSPAIDVRNRGVKELGFFIASIVEQVKDGKPQLETSRATRIELIR
jgi:hypothetical protein